MIACSKHQCLRHNQVIGTLSVIDSCSSIGKAYTNPIIPVAPGKLSTISLDIPLGFTFNDRAFYRTNVSSYTKAVRTEDLLCPTWGLGNVNASEYFKQSTVGPPYNPIIDPPAELLTFDPGKSYCTIDSVRL